MFTQSRLLLVGQAVVKIDTTSKITNIRLLLLAVVDIDITFNFIIIWLLLPAVVEIDTTYNLTTDSVSCCRN
jgi:hypothetical protein